MEENNTSDFTLYILLSVSGLLLVIDGLELFHIIFNWQYGFSLVKPIFENCLKFELISKTIFSIFSFIAASSAFTLTLFLLCAPNFFLGQFLRTYLFVNYFFFGPMMGALSILGIYYWEDVVYVCDKKNLNLKEVSVSNSVTIIGCFLISVLITVLVEFLESFNFLLDSILKRDSGSPTIGRFFWQIVLSRANQARMRAYNGNNNSANDQNNSNTNANNQIVVLNVNDNNVFKQVDLERDYDVMVVNLENRRVLNENDLHNERQLLPENENLLITKELNQEKDSREVNMNKNNFGNYTRLDLIHEAEIKNNIEKNINNPVEFSKNS